MLVFELVIKYFWLLAVLVGFINYLMYKVRYQNKFSGEEEKLEVNAFLKSLFFFYTVPFALLALLQLLGRFENGFFIAAKDFDNIFVILSWAVLLGYWFVILHWVLLRDGARTLIKFLFASANETMVKICAVLIVAVSVIGLAIAVNQDLYTQVNSFLDAMTAPM